MKNFRTTFHCVVFLQLRKEGHKKLKIKNRTIGQICVLVLLVLGPSPSGYKTMKKLSIVLTLVHLCALLSFNCGEAVLERSWNQDLRVQHKKKKKRNRIEQQQKMKEKA